MFRRLASHITYANTVATLALFVALGGTSYAAIHLGRNTVGAAQIKASAVGSSEVRNGSLRISDLSTSSRAALKGQAGPAGPQGPAGAPAVGYFAAIGSGGQAFRGNAKASNHTSSGSGSYTIIFPRDVSACAYTTTLGTADGSPPPTGQAAVSSDAQGAVVVQTTDLAGNPKDLPFHVIVAC